MIAGSIRTTVQAEPPPRLGIKINGRVIDVEGNPIQNVHVTAYRQGSQAGPDATTLTSKLGEFRLHTTPGRPIDEIRFLRTKFYVATLTGIGDDPDQFVCKVLVPNGPPKGWSGNLEVVQAIERVAVSVLRSSTEEAATMRGNIRRQELNLAAQLQTLEEQPARLEQVRALLKEAGLDRP
jgi:hypothetical protein